MTPQVISLSAAGSTAWIPVDYIQNPFFINLALVFSNTPNLICKVEYTLDNIFDPLVTPTAFAHTSLTGITSNTVGSITYPVRAIRLTITTWTSGTVTLTALQGTSNPQIYTNSGINGTLTFAPSEVPSTGSIPSRLIRMVRQNVWLYRSPATSSQNNGAFFCYVPTGNGEYSGFVFGRNFGSSTIELCLGRVFAGVIGSYKHHSAATKVGIWTTSSYNYAPNGDIAYSTTAGDTVSFSNVVGHTLVARTMLISNGGMYIVSIDGDSTKANRLPTFTSTDLSNGLCRAEDVGKRYINTYYASTIGDQHVPLATNLVDESHTIVFEATGTKSPSSGGTRSYISGVVGCSVSDIGQTVSASRVIAHVESVTDLTSAFTNVACIETATPNTYEFLGNVHSGGTEISGVVKLDSTDVSSMSVNTWASGKQVSIHVITTVANTADTGTVVATRDTDYLLSSYLYAPLTVIHKTTFAVQKRVAPNYVMMLPTSGFRMDNHNNPGISRWDRCEFGNYVAQSGELSTFDGSSRGNCEADFVKFASTQHDYTVYAAILDNLATANWFMKGGDTPVFLNDRTDKVEKVYFCRSVTMSPETFLAGETVSGAIAYGIVKNE